MPRKRRSRRRYSSPTLVRSKIHYKPRTPEERKAECLQIAFEAFRMSLTFLKTDALSRFIYDLKFKLYTLQKAYPLKNEPDSSDEDDPEGNNLYEDPFEPEEFTKEKRFLKLVRIAILIQKFDLEFLKYLKVLDYKTYMEEIHKREKIIYTLKMVFACQKKAAMKDFEESKAYVLEARRPIYSWYHFTLAKKSYYSFPDNRNFYNCWEEDFPFPTNAEMNVNEEYNVVFRLIGKKEKKTKRMNQKRLAKMVLKSMRSEITKKAFAGLFDFKFDLFEPKVESESKAIAVREGSVADISSVTDISTSDVTSDFGSSSDSLYGDDYMPEFYYVDGEKVPNERLMRKRRRRSLREKIEAERERKYGTSSSPSEDEKDEDKKDEDDKKEGNIDTEETNAEDVNISADQIVDESEFMGKIGFDDDSKQIANVVDNLDLVTIEMEEINGRYEDTELFHIYEKFRELLGNSDPIIV